MSWLFLAIVVGRDQKTPDDPPAVEETVRRLLDQQFSAISPDRRAVYSVRFAAAYHRLPRDPGLRTKALESITTWIQHAAIHLNAMDMFRVSAARHPELRPLLLPEEYFDFACRKTVERVEAKTDRSLLHAAGIGLPRAAVAEQLERLRADSSALLKRLPDPEASEYAVGKVRDTMDHLLHVADDPFYGYDKTLTKEEYAHILHELGERMLRLPIVVPGAGNSPEERADPNATEGHHQVVSTRERNRELIRDAIDEMFMRYSRTCGLSSWTFKDAMAENLDRAMSWMGEARRKHEGVLNRIHNDARAKDQEGDTARKNSRDLPGEPMQEGAAAVTNPGKTKPAQAAAKRTGETSGWGGRWMILGLLALIAGVAYIGCKARMRSV